MSQRSPETWAVSQWSQASQVSGLSGSHHDNSENSETPDTFETCLQHLRPLRLLRPLRHSAAPETSNMSKTKTVCWIILPKWEGTGTLMVSSYKEQCLRVGRLHFTNILLAVFAISLVCIDGF